ncbi:tetratricopeptide repeat protein [Pedosphaera parvula]|uniref:TPR repeat-containing protein n=1 Tax=Pedosphaera parvula (strain Ellin514) TaxID=320771 RepID=B9XD44_PEDPL|nr:tetratricopeptide repeat protein [Pedosphaera parvula]EEF62390.1 TPR repeat-containing protein [Pedosphaera parvula Ellin514]
MSKDFQRTFNWVAVLFLATAAVSCTQQSHLKRADRYFQLEDYDHAEVEYINVIRKDPKNAHGFANLGAIYVEQGRFSRAFTFLSRARELDPTGDPGIHMKIGSLYFSAGRMKEAQEEVKYVLEKRPQDQDAPMLLADLASTSQEVEQTRQALQKLLAAGGYKPACEVAISTLLIKQNNLKGAEEAINRALDIDKKFGPAYLALANLHLIKNEVKEAEQALKAAADNASAHSPRRVRYALFKIQHGEMEQGKVLLKAIVQKTPDNLPAWQALAETALSEKQFDEAMAIIDKVLIRDPENFDFLQLHGRTYLGKGDSAKALAEFEKTVRLYPQSPQAFYHLALAQMVANDSPKALGSLKQALALNRSYPEAQLLSAEIYIRSGDLNSAVALLTQLVRQQPRLVQAQLLLAEAYRARGNYAEALGIYDQLRQSFPHEPQYVYKAGLTFIQMNKKEEAQKAFEKVLVMSPDNLPALEQIVNLDIQAQDYSKALSLLDKEMANEKIVPELCVLQARIFESQKATQKAVAALKRAIELNPQMRIAYFLLARLYMESKQNEQAITNLQEVMVKNPKDTSALMMIGTIRDQEKNFAAARDAYEKLIAIDPNFSAALNNLAYLYSEHFNQLDKALEMARRARELMVYDPSTADTLGWILFKKAQYAAALTLNREAADKLPGEPEIQFHVGMGYYMLGKEESARLYLQRALQLKSDFFGHEEASLRLSILAIDPKSGGDDVQSKLEKRIADQPEDEVALCRLAGIYERTGAFQKAADAYQKALKTSPDNAKVMASLALLYSDHLNNQQKALELAKNAHSLSPEDADISGALGHIAFLSRDYKWSLSLLQEADQKSPGNVGRQFDYAKALYSVGHVEEATGIIQKTLQSGAATAQAEEAKRWLEMINLAANPTQALKETPRIEAALKADAGCVPALVAVAAGFEQKADAASARKSYEKVLELFPEFIPAKRKLAMLYSDDPAKDNQTYEMAVQARELFRNDPGLTKALGIVAYRKGDYTKSTELLKESAKGLSDDAGVLYYLGMSQYKLKKRVESKASLQHALELHLSTQFASEARRVLTELN